MRSGKIGQEYLGTKRNDIFEKIYLKRKINLSHIFTILNFLYPLIKCLPVLWMRCWWKNILFWLFLIQLFQIKSSFIIGHNITQTPYTFVKYVFFSPAKQLIPNFAYIFNAYKMNIHIYSLIVCHVTLHGRCPRWRAIRACLF